MIETYEVMPGKMIFPDFKNIAFMIFSMNKGVIVYGEDEGQLAQFKDLFLNKLPSLSNYWGFHNFRNLMYDGYFAEKHDCDVCALYPNNAFDLECESEGCITLCAIVYDDIACLTQELLDHIQSQSFKRMSDIITKNRKIYLPSIVS